MSENVLVVDVGTSCLKAGFAGDDSPLSIIPSFAQKCPSGVESMEPSPYYSESDALKNLHPLQRGKVRNWEHLESLWRVMLEDVGVVSADTTSVLITEPPLASIPDRAKWAQMLFENFRVPSIYIASNAPLSLFASGRTSGLVVESGAGLSSSVPVFEGLALAHATNVMEYAGQDISYNIQLALQDNGIQTDLNYARLLKERMAFVPLHGSASSPEQHMNGAGGKNIGSPPGSGHGSRGGSGRGSPVHPEEVTRFSLPDGTEVKVAKSLFGQCTDDLFTNSSFDPPGLISQVYDSLKLCDDSVQRELYNNIIICGGTSMITGFGDRIQNEIAARLSKETQRYQRHIKLRVMPNSTNREAGYTSQRKIAAWTGGSIVASLDTFKQIKITRQEWEEDADACIRTKYV